MALRLLQPSLRPLGQFDLKDDETITGGECVVLEGDGGSSTETRAKDVETRGPLANGAELRFALGEFERGKLCGLADDGSNGYGTNFGTMIGGSAGQGVTVQLNTGSARSGSTVVLGPATHLASGKVTVWHAPGLYAVDAQPLAASGDMPTALNIEVNAAGGTVDSQVDIGGTAAQMVIDAATAANQPVFAAANGKLHTKVDAALTRAQHFNVGGVATVSASPEKSDQLGTFVGCLKDASSVSTPLSLAQGLGGFGIGGSVDGVGSAYSSTAEEYVIYFLGNQGLV